MTPIEKCSIAGVVTLSLLLSISTANKVMWSQAHVVVVLFVREATTWHPVVDQVLFSALAKGVVTLRNAHARLILTGVAWRGMKKRYVQKIVKLLFLTKVTI